MIDYADAQTYAPQTTAPRALRRFRLTEQLDRSCHGRITLVCAPPGTGKTTLVADWVASRPDRLALWFDLYGVANEPEAFREQLTRTLERAGLTSDRQLFGITPLAQVLDRGDIGSDIVIILDDAQDLTDRDAWHDITRLATTSPPWLHWIIITRVDPPIGIRRLQLHGHLAQIRVADLAFNVAETDALMLWFGLELPADAVRRLARWSEGWAAALCLAARTMQSENIDTRPWERLGESESVVLDFLVEEVLNHLSTQDRRFLLRSSAADLLTPELAAELTGNARAGERLHRLERAGTFLLEVDPSGSRYRFHGLMAALLRARLNDEIPSEVRHLTSTAAHWYSDHGYLEEAERHAIRAEEWSLVGQLRAKRCADHLISTGGLISGLRNLPSTIPASDPAIHTLAILDAMRRNDRRTVEQLASTVLGSSEAPALTPEVLLLTQMVSVEQSRWIPDTADPLARSLGTEIVHDSQDPSSRGALSAYVALRDAESLIANQRLEEGRRTLDEIVKMNDASDWTRRDAEAILAVIDVAAGDPRRATSISRVQLVNASNDGAMWLNVAAAVAHSLRGETTGLRRRAEALTASNESTRSWLLEQCTRMLVGVTSWSASTVAPLLEPPPAGLPTSVAIALGVVETIDRQGRPCPIGGPLEHSIAAARRALTDASTRRLDSCLDPWLSTKDVYDEHPRSAVELYALAAVAEVRRECEGAALKWIEKAIELAAPTGLWGPLHVYERDLRTIVERHGWELGAAHPAAVEMLETFRADHTSPTEALTDRERVVLHYLPTLMSNAEIAAEMVVSVNTVKTHLKSIYRKLGVERRRDALLKARQVELL
ncbi:MAG TPA: LuxR C-terminal-related transcriptional regulator [Ilumatobacteraceae bacterium]|nr:LuxR C-terminal-related transcriptional regulator [Ilumatobacteraceae bacterium]